MASVNKYFTPMKTIRHLSTFWNGSVIHPVQHKLPRELWHQVPMVTMGQHWGINFEMTLKSFQSWCPNADPL